MPTPTRSLRIVAATAAIAAGIAFAACGDDDATDATSDNGGSAAAVADKPEDKPDGSAAGTQPASDDGQIRALFARVQKAFVTPGQGETICDALTDRGQRDIVDFGRGTGISASSCTPVANAMVQREIDMKTEQRPTKILTVRVRGDRATALIRIAGATPLRQRYVNQDGQWKITSFNLSAAVSGGSSPPQ